MYFSISLQYLNFSQPTHVSLKYRRLRNVCVLSQINNVFVIFMSLFSDFFCVFNLSQKSLELFIKSIKTFMIQLKWLMGQEHSCRRPSYTQIRFIYWDILIINWRIRIHNVYINFYEMPLNSQTEIDLSTKLRWNNIDNWMYKKVVTRLYTKVT